jgi:hypothetical protein
MPATLAAEQGTQVMGAGAVAAAASARTVAAPTVPKTRVASPERGGPAAPDASTASHVPDAPARKGRLPMPAIAAAVVILLGGGGWVAVQMLGGGAKASPDSSAAPPSVTNPNAANPNAANSGPEKSGTTKQLSAPVTPPGAGGRKDGAPPAGGSAAPAGFNAAPELQRIADLVDKGDKSSASAALDAVSQLLPKLRTRDDSVDALYHKAEAYGTIDEDGARACPVLKSIATDAKRQKGAANLIAALLCK